MRLESEIKRFENAVDELDKTLLERFKVIRKVIGK